MDPYPRTWAVVDLRVLRGNLAYVRSQLGAGGAQIALVAKADAYGHGLLPVCRFAVAHGADAVAVATVQEGVSLREAGVECPVMVMSPILPVDCEQAVFYNLDVFVENVALAKAMDVAAARQTREARVHLKVDTGLHRFGCAPKDASTIAHEIDGFTNCRLVGLCQHFSDSSSDEQSTAKQLWIFDQAHKECRARSVKFEHVHMANSGAALKYPASRGTMVRIGVLAYGVDPFGLTNGAVTPAMSWFGRVTSLRMVPAGAKLGYAGTFTTTRQTVVATVGVGYGDGYQRHLSNKGFVALNGQRAAVIGLVCMDQLLVDATGIQNLAVGSVAELLGPNVSASELASLAGTNAHEILTGITARVPRRYVYPEN
ncbi:MAG: alanine racemase [Fimbriimonadaceae bacterium]|nr:alanine racemase [Fimbriimonadaceae bacterium]